MEDEDGLALDMRICMAIAEALYKYSIRRKKKGEGHGEGGQEDPRVPHERGKVDP